MTATTAPERRRGPLGQTQVRVRDEWLDEDAPGTMAAWSDWQDALRNGHQELARAPQEPRKATEPTREPTARQRQVWAAVKEHGSQTAAGRALGVSQGAIQSGLTGYMRAMGMRGPLPGRRRPKEAKPPALSVVEPVSQREHELAVGLESSSTPPDDSPPPEPRPIVNGGHHDLRPSTGYARGFAVATLLALAAAPELTDVLRSMATEAAEGLLR